MTEAYERTLRKLSLVDRSDPITELIAREIIEIGRRGVREAESYPKWPSWSLKSSKAVSAGGLVITVTLPSC